MTYSRWRFLFRSGVWSLVGSIASIASPLDAAGVSKPKQRAAVGKSSHKLTKKIAVAKDSEPSSEQQVSQIGTIEAHSAPKFEFVPYLGRTSHSGNEIGVLSTLYILPAGLPMSFRNALALEFGMARARWEGDDDTRNRFSAIADGLWSVGGTERLAPYLAAGLNYNRRWRSSGSDYTAAEGEMELHGKIGASLKLTDALSMRTELDPSLEVFRIGIALTL